jgi:uncharacterized membrane protein
MRILTLMPAVALVSLLALSACGGGGADVESQSDVRATTTGQELLDLKKAYDSGTITQQEYETQRKKILDRE